MGETLSSLDDLARKFIASVRNARTVDWYLIKLTTVVSTIEEEMRSLGSSYNLFKEFLSRSDVRDALRPLACRIEDVEMLLNTVRFRDLAKYRDLIISTLRTIPCNEESISVSRPSTYYVEFFETRSRSTLPSAIRASKHYYSPRRALMIVCTIAAITTLITVVLCSLVLR